MSDVAVTIPGQRTGRGTTRRSVGWCCAPNAKAAMAGDSPVIRASRPCQAPLKRAERAPCLTGGRTSHGRDARVTGCGARVTGCCVVVQQSALGRCRGHVSCDNGGFPRRSARLTAFTLVEVLAALLLVAIVLPVVMQGISLATGAASSAKRRTEAVSLAQSKMAELYATEGWRGGSLSGRFTSFDGVNAADYSWRADVTGWTEPYVRQLAVHVSWDRTAGEQTITLTTLVYEGRPRTEGDGQDAAAGGSGGVRQTGSRIGGGG